MDDKFVYVDKLELEGKAKGRYFNVNGDSLYIYQTYNHAKEDCSFLQIFSWSQKKELSYKKFDYEFPQYTHIGYGKHYLDFGKNCYLAAQGITYKIDIYSYDHTQIEEIALEDDIHFPLLKKTDLELFKNQKSVAMRPMNYMNDLIELGNKGSRIWEAQFVHDSLIIVKYSVPDQEKGMIFKDDLWLKKNGEWILTETIPLYCQNDERINSSNFWRFNLYNSANIIAYGKMYYILFNSATKTFDITYEEFSTNERMNETQLKIYTVDFNE